VGNASYLLIRNQLLLLPRITSEISISSNHLKATTSSQKEGKRKKQSQTTKMTSDLTPAATIAARLWHRRLAHHNNGVAERMICTITERARALYWILKYLSSFGGKQSTRLHIFINACPTRGSQREIIAMAAYLHQRMPNDQLMPNEGLTRRDNRYGHKASYNTPYEMLHSYARSRAYMMVSYLHDSTTLWRIWDQEHNTVKAQSDVIFDMENNTYISCPQSLKRKQGVHDDQPEENTEIDIRSTARRISY
jgi:hypothetical protein